MGDHSGHSDLVTGCWNLQGFESAQFYLMKTLVNFNIFAISEHWLFSEVLHNIDKFSSPGILSRKRALAGVGLG